MNANPTYAIKRPGPSLPAFSQQSLFGSITSTTPPSARASTTLPAKILSGVLLGTAVAPGVPLASQGCPPAIPAYASREAKTPVTVPGKIELVRGAFGVSISALAEILNVSRPTIYQWIKGQSELSAENRTRLDRVASFAVRWNQAFPASNMDHWLTDNEPGVPSLLDLMKATDLDTDLITATLTRRIHAARESRDHIAAERKMAGDAGFIPKPDMLPEAVKRWSSLRSGFIRSSNIQG